MEAAEQSKAMPRLRVLVGVHDGGFNGIDAYSEQIVASALEAGHEVTLAATQAAASRLRTRLGPAVRILELDLPLPGRVAGLAARIWPRLDRRRLGRALTAALLRSGQTFDVIHLNRPGLAPVMRRFTRRLVSAAWFYPHAPVHRAVETWRHTEGGQLLRRMAITLKSFSHYLGDVEGFRASDCVVAPTPSLSDQLRAQGIQAVVCPPPVEVQRTHPPFEQEGRAADLKRLVICSGDLSHPRKNLLRALEALPHLAQRGWRLRVEVIGRNPERLQAMARTLPVGIEVNFTGSLPAEQVQAHMRSADVFLFPSLYEEWGYAAVEALLCGTPVVTFPVYPFHSMLAGGLGEIAQDLSARGLADAVERAFRLTDRSGLAMAAAARFGSSVVARRLTEIWTLPLGFHPETVTAPREESGT